ncbi:MAG: energy transducer TonB [Chitinophagaceae bacterium]|nr:energy transducer TonB [Chitinophagaceae bacterium]
MNRNQILKTDILDIIFENRNKAYGAYELRKFYPTRIKNALFFMAITSAAFLVFTLLPKKESTMIKTDFPFPEIILKDVFIEPEKPVIKREMEKPVAEAAKPFNQKILTSSILIVSNKEKTNSIVTLLPTDVIGTKNIDHAQPGTVLVEPVKPGNGNAEPGNNTTKIDVTIPMDLDAVDVPPAFPGGMDALKNFLERNLKNPYDLENGETINVRIRFVVGYNGKLQSFTTVFDGGEIYNKEVIRVLKKMPDWQPGKARGENVSVYYTIPVKFVMSD